MSAPATVAELCAWTGGQLIRGHEDQTFTGTVIDSRAVGAGDLFVAIVGPNHDAHRFVGDVLMSGAAGALAGGYKARCKTCIPCPPRLMLPRARS